MDIKVKDIIKTCNAKLVFGDEEIVCENFSKDTRTIEKDDVYVGIKGENFDGNSLYIDALEKGARVCILQDIIVDEDTMNKYNDRAVILVNDTIKALQSIASLKRSLYNIPVVAITGSVGKTSTKDIIASVVGEQYKVLKTQGNLNNHIGLPMTILQLKDHEALVIEMGMNNLGEISVLSKIGKPDIAVITNVGTSHIGNLGSRENILKAKLEILDGLKSNGTLVINNDNDLLSAWNKNYSGDINIVTYGINNNSDFIASDIVMSEESSKFKLKYMDNESEIIVPVGGEHFIYNALSAVVVGTIMGITLDKIKKGIENFQLTKSRMEKISLPENITVINDCYNANYDSMKAAIEFVARTNAKRKIAVLGDMLELGEFSEELHKKVGEAVVNNNIDMLITVGSMAKIIASTAAESNIEVYEFDNNMQAIEKIKEVMQKDDIILVKASNGMKFNEIIGELKK